MKKEQKEAPAPPPGPLVSQPTVAPAMPQEPLAATQNRTSRCRVWVFLSIMILVKMILATARRLIFPFAVFVAAHLETSLSLLSFALATMRISGMIGLLAAPSLWAWWASASSHCCRCYCRCCRRCCRGGTGFCRGSTTTTFFECGSAKAVMVGALLMQIAVSLFITVPNTIVVLVFISLSGIAKGLFDPSALSLQRAVFVEATVQQRQVSATFVELNWGLSSLFGVPLCGLLLGVDFRLPFWAMAAAITVMLPCLFIILRGIDDLRECDNRPSEEVDGDGDDTVTTFEGSDSAANCALGAGKCVASTDNDPLDVCVAVEMASSILKQPNSLPADSMGKISKNTTITTTKAKASCSCRRLRSVARSRRTLSNFLDAFFSATTMGLKDVTFGLWLTKTHGYDESGVAGAAIVLGLADISGEVLLTLLLLKNGCVSAGGMAIPTWLSTAGGIAFFWATTADAPSSPAIGLGAIYFISMFMEMKAVQCLSIAATTDEPGLDGGLPEIAAYSGSSIGFAIGTLLAPLLWESGGESVFSAVTLGVAGVAVLVKVCLSSYSPSHCRSTRSDNEGSNREEKVEY